LIVQSSVSKVPAALQFCAQRIIHLGPFGDGSGINVILTSDLKQCAEHRHEGDNTNAKLKEERAFHPKPQFWNIWALPG
jgi:hypothetical protein